MNQLARWWDGLEDPERIQWTAVAGTVLLFCVHFVVYSPWLIEDAAISYSYALHGATGEGWVAYAGGERVEGFSNPSWTALLTVGRFVGISPWLMGKWLGLVFGVLTLPVAFLWARRATGERTLWPVLAPLWLAVSPQFVAWACSGLENPLWMWCLAVGALGFLRELDGDGPSWSALPMALLAITRPEGPLYVAAMAFTGVALCWRQPRIWGRIALWATACAAVWAAYVAYRYQVFGWPLPNTYYAKLHVGVEKFQLLKWGTPGAYLIGWPYLRSWALWSTLGFLLPLFPVAATGFQGWRGQVGLGTGAVLALLLVPGADWLVTQPWWPLEPEPQALITARIGLLLGTALALPWLGLGREGDRARILAWMLAAAMFLFVIYVGSDWMKGHRWVSLGVVPISVMFADLVVALLRSREWEDPERAARVILATVAGLPLVAAVVHTSALQNPTEITPFDVGRRVAYMNGVQERLHHDHAVQFDVDMGANQWWSGDRIVDIAGLIDTPVAQHAWEPAFVREYVLRERRPDFMHTHGHWHTQSKMAAQPTFRKDYLKIDDFVSGPGGLHTGNYVRRDLFLRPRWSGTPDPVDFAGKVRLEGLDLPSPLVPAGGTLYVELGWRPLVSRLPPFRAILVLARGDRVVATDLPPAYDWLFPPEWRKSEVVHGFHSVRVPPDLEAGDWDLALVVQNPAGIWPADRERPRPVYAAGEVLWSGRVRVAPREEVLAQVDALLQAFGSEAGSGACTEAEATLERARRHLDKEDPAQPWSRPEVHTELARCWARTATESPVQAAESAIERARVWDHRDPVVIGIGKTLADTWEREGDEAWAEGRSGAAYGAWRRTLAADPSRSAVRVRAEQARDLRLGLVESESP